MSYRSTTVKITRTDTYFECEFPPIQRRGIQRNGCGAVLFGALPCAIVPLVMIYIFQVIRDRSPTSHGTMAQLENIFAGLWFWGCITLGVILTTVFMVVALVTFLKGGKAWLKIQGRSMKARSFFGGESRSNVVDVTKIAEVLVEPLPKESDHVQRGQIRITGPEIEDVIVGDGYPVRDLEKVADELQEYIRGLRLEV